jgi:hypothetical protein
VHVNGIGAERRGGAPHRKLSTSSISTMVCGLRAAISGMVSVISVVMLR